MVFDLIPVEMRFPSVITIVLFSVGMPFFWYLHRKITNLEDIVIARCIDIEKIGELVNNLEDMTKSIKDDNRRTIDWIRDENSAQWERVEKNMAEIRQKLYKGG